MEIHMYPLNIKPDSMENNRFQKVALRCEPKGDTDIGTPFKRQL
jgi:hypothetical protein